MTEDLKEKVAGYLLSLLWYVEQAVVGSLDYRNNHDVVASYLITILAIIAWPILALFGITPTDYWIFVAMCAGYSGMFLVLGYRYNRPELWERRAEEIMRDIYKEEAPCSKA